MQEALRRENDYTQWDMLSRIYVYRNIKNGKWKERGENTYGISIKDLPMQRLKPGSQDTKHDYAPYYVSTDDHVLKILTG